MAGQLRKRRDPEISPLDALRILRSGIPEHRPATDFDWGRLDAVIANRRPPKDAVTIRQIMDKTGFSKTKTQVFLNGLVKAGEMVANKYPAAKSGWVHYYSWVKKPSKSITPG